MADPQIPKMYVLTGNDWDYKEHSIRFEQAKKDPSNVLNAFDLRTILNAYDLSIKNAAKRVKAPANVVLAAHGDTPGLLHWNGSFKWSNYDLFNADYGDFFAALPRNGIESVTIESCNGGLAETYSQLAKAPPGAIVLTLVSRSSLGYLPFTAQFAKETEGMTKPVDLFLKALDTFDPAIYAAYADAYNRKHSFTKHVDSNPEHALPHIIGIGGNQPVIIDLNDKVDELVSKKAGDFNAAAWQAAVKQVQSRFDTKNYRSADKQDPGYGVEGDLGEAGERQLHAHIAEIAGKIRDGNTPPWKPHGAEEKRIAYALAAAYMDQSGELAHLVAQAKSAPPEPSWWERAIQNVEAFLPHMRNDPNMRPDKKQQHTPASQLPSPQTPAKASSQKISH